MVFADFSNEYLRRLLAGGGYCRTHRRRLGRVRGRVGRWAARARREEAAGAGRPLAAVFDIDEVLLSNIHMNVHLAPATGPRPAVEFYACDYFTAPGGQPWPRGDVRLNPLLPGARELLEETRRHGVEVFLVTGRRESIRDETVENLAYVELAGPDGPLAGVAAAGRLLMRPDGDGAASVRPFKEGCRAEIEKTHRIVFNIGDQASDLGPHGDHQVLVPHSFYLTA